MKPTYVRMRCGFHVGCKFPLWNQHLCRSDTFLICSGVPAWKCLVSCPINLDERVSLVAGVFSDLGEIEAVKQLHEVDAQSFINTIDEVLSHCSFFTGYKFAEPETSHLPSRFWIDWHQTSGESV